MSPTQEQFLAELESLGVGPVKERIATKVNLGGLANVAQGWVERKEAASNAEQLALAHQANITAAVKLDCHCSSRYCGDLHDCEPRGATQTLIGPG
jgi:hypothetical protein